MNRKKRTISTEEGPADNITVRARAEPNSEGKFNLEGEANEIKESIIEHANKYYRNISKGQLKKELNKISDEELKDHIADKHSLDHFIHSVSKKTTKPQFGTKGNETSMARVYEVTIKNEEGTSTGAKKVFEAIKYHAVATAWYLITSNFFFAPIFAPSLFSIVTSYTLAMLVSFPFVPNCGLVAFFLTLCMK